MYREALALAVQRHRPDAEVMLVPDSVLDGQVDGFDPHVLVRNDTDAEVPEKLLGSVVCRVEVLFTDHLSARVSVGGRSYTIEDSSMGDLLSLVDEAGAAASVPRAGGDGSRSGGPGRPGLARLFHFGVPLRGDLLDGDPVPHERLPGGLAPAPHPHLLVDVGQVALDGARRDVQR